MFGKKKTTNETHRAKISTLIGESSSVEGVVKFTGGMHVAGSVHGGALSDDPESLLIISENALVTGDVKVANLIVNGQIDGDVFVSGKVELFDKARINGDVHYSLLELPVGAEVNGKLIRQDKETESNS